MQRHAQLVNFENDNLMLQNEPTLAIGGLDTDENGPSKVRQVTNKIRHNIGHSNSAGPML